MGHHYVPQKYLSYFSTPHDPKSICVFDKFADRWFEAPIKSVAQERDFYEAVDEVRLANEVEAPGNAALYHLAKLKGQLRFRRSV